jgi:ketosteroid isomerase-like protein
MSESTEREQQYEALIREGIEAFDRGDINALLELFHDDLEVYVQSDLPNAGRFHGKDEYVRWLGTWLEAWDEFTVRVTRMELVGERHVVCDVRQIGRGKGSGIPVEMDIVYLWEIRDGKLASQHLYSSAEQAREVAEQGEREAAAE